MTTLLILLCVILISTVFVQIGKMTELSARIRGQEDAEASSNNFNANMMLVFLVGFLIFCIVSAIYYKNSLLGYGPHQSASVHGIEMDYSWNLTLFFTGIVFVLTHIALFYFSWKYKGVKGRKALFFAHDNKLEIIWTTIPAVVMCFLVIQGLVAWNKIMADVGPNEEHIEIEANGQQFFWTIRMPGDDGLLGETYYRDISATNPMGQVWTDEKNLDDIVSTGPGEVIKLPIGKKVRVRITAKDVLHNFDLPHFRVKMDAIPGLPTYFVFTPNITTEDYREKLLATDRNGDPLYPEWYDVFDETSPELGNRGENFKFELACAELCGKGHYSMRRIFEIVTEEEYENWLATQKSFYFSSVRGTDEDPYGNRLFDSEIRERKQVFRDAYTKALETIEPMDKIIRLDNITFNTGSATLTPLSKYELTNVMEVMNENQNLTIELGGHTDSSGGDEANMTLSNQRAQEVFRWLTSKGVDANRMVAIGFGETKPEVPNDSPENMAKNRRTELRILTQ